jgi:8-oxo-dGTP pyrophosphatase MutT (NUDIX family)
VPPSPDHEIPSAEPIGLLVQHALARSGAWSLVAGGCHPACDTLAAIAAAGFEIER